MEVFVKTMIEELKANGGLFRQPADNRIMATAEFWYLFQLYYGPDAFKGYKALVDKGFQSAKLKGHYPLIARSPEIQEPGKYNNYVYAALMHSWLKTKDLCPLAQDLLLYGNKNHWCFLPAPVPGFFTKRRWQYCHMPYLRAFYWQMLDFHPFWFNRLWFRATIFFACRKPYNDVSSKKLCLFMLISSRDNWARGYYSRKMKEQYGKDYIIEIFRIYYGANPGTVQLYEFCKMVFDRGLGEQ